MKHALIIALALAFLVSPALAWNKKHEGFERSHNTERHYKKDERHYKKYKKHKKHKTPPKDPPQASVPKPPKRTVRTNDPAFCFCPERGKNDCRQKWTYSQRITCDWRW